MNRSQFIAFVRDVHAHPERLAYYRKKYKNVYPFSDGIFKMLMANEAKHERTIKFLNAMLGLYGGNAIKTFTLGVPENPGVLNDKTAIFDIYGITEANSPILIEVQQTTTPFSSTGSSTIRHASFLAQSRSRKITISPTSMCFRS